MLGLARMVGMTRARILTGCCVSLGDVLVVLRDGFWVNLGIVVGNHVQFQNRNVLPGGEIK